MSVEIEIRGHGGHLRVEVLGYENPSAQDLSDANWLSCDVLVEVSAFSGNISCSFSTQDFIQFRDELRELLANRSGIASFLTDEEHLGIRLEMEATGIVRIEGMAQIYDMPQATLSFSFESDGSFLTTALRDLEKLIKVFPVKGEILQ